MIRSLVLSASLLASAAVAQTAPAAPDPARLALGRSIAAQMLPDGTYRRIMNGTLSHLMDGVTQQMMTMPVAQLARMGGVSPTDVQKLGQTNLRQIMQIMDPAYEKRMGIVTPLMMQQVGEVMGRYEPTIRDGLAEAYANDLSMTELTDLSHFLQTPSGAAYAAKALMIQSDPAVVAKMQAIMPEIFKAMPAIMEKVQAATADLPKPKTAADLTDADRAQLAKLLGVDPAKLKTSAKEPTS